MSSRAVAVTLASEDDLVVQAHANRFRRIATSRVKAILPREGDGRRFEGCVTTQRQNFFADQLVTPSLIGWIWFNGLMIQPRLRRILPAAATAAEMQFRWFFGGSGTR